jgi:penicillin-insensitive murein endopeptidase
MEIGNPRRRRWPWWLAAVVVLWLALLRFGNDVAIALESEAPSRSHGTPANGHLEHGKRLPSRGANFRAHSQLGTLIGRNAVHDRLRDTIVAAYADLAVRRQGTTYVYGEMGWPSGGRFRPHRTHRNGLAADFFVPVRDKRRAERELPTHPFNLFGYGIEFDDQGRWRDLQVDYPALADHLDALAIAANARGLRIEVVILDEGMQRALFAAEGGGGLRQRMRFSRQQPWIRHDEHYHVVFVPTR